MMTNIGNDPVLMLSEKLRHELSWLSDNLMPLDAYFSLNRKFETDSLRVALRVSDASHAEKMCRVIEFSGLNNFIRVVEWADSRTSIFVPLYRIVRCIADINCSLLLLKQKNSRLLAFCVYHKLSVQSIPCFELLNGDIVPVRNSMEWLNIETFQELQRIWLSELFGALKVGQRAPNFHDAIIQHASVDEFGHVCTTLQLNESSEHGEEIRAHAEIVWKQPGVDVAILCSTHENRLDELSDIYDLELFKYGSRWCAVISFASGWRVVLCFSSVEISMFSGWTNYDG
jgi:hypothetical protein